MSMQSDRHLSTSDNGESYEDYVATTVDPGNTLFIIAIIFCISSILFLPLVSKLLDQCLKYRKRKREEKENATNNDNNVHEGYYKAEEEDFDDFLDYATDHGCSNLSCVQNCKGIGYSAAIYYVVDTNIVRWRKRGSHARSNIDWRREMVSRGVKREARYVDSVKNSVEIVLQSESGENGVDPKSQGDEAKTEIKEAIDTPNESQENQLDLNNRNENEDLTQTPHTFDLLHRASLFMYTIIKYDNETKRILRLAIPFTFSAIASTMADLVIVGIISQNLGTDSMVAFAMTDVLVGITSSFAGGLVEAISSLGSMSFGARNYTRCGEYVINSCLCYAICEIVFSLFWVTAISPIIILMGFDETVAELAQGYVYYKVAVNLLEGIEECFLDFLEVVEYEAYANIMNCMNSVVELVLVGVAATRFGANLKTIGLIMLANQVFFLTFNVACPKIMGWLRIFEPGLSKYPLTNTSLLKELVKTAVPLAFGNLLAYAEWEMLTVFALILGPAEGIVWAMLGFIWDVFESTTEAISDAGEVRCAYQLGRGRSELARLSAYKSMFISGTLAFAVSTIFACLRNSIPKWLSQDETLQDMLAELIPLIALGNLSMNVGMCCWALIGAQGRYRLATSIAVACSILVTLPIAAVMTIGMRLDLQGLTFAVVTGYTVTAMLLSSFLLTSDWEKLSSKILARMEAEEESESEVSDVESNASSVDHVLVPSSNQKPTKQEDDSSVWEIVEAGSLYGC